MFIPSATIPERGMNANADLAQSHRALIGRIAEHRDKDAFAELFDWYAPRVKAMLVKQCGSSEMAEDIMQDVFLTVWLKAGQFASSKGAVSTWIFTIARNRRIDVFRKQSSWHYVGIGEMEFPDEAPESADVLLSGEQDSLVAQAAATLPEEMREVIHLAFVEEKSQSQIAGELGIPLGTVKSRTRRAFEKIKQQLEGVL